MRGHLKDTTVLGFMFVKCSVAEARTSGKANWFIFCYCVFCLSVFFVWLGIRVADLSHLHALCRSMYPCQPFDGESLIFYGVANWL